MKRVFVLLTVLTALLCLVGCGVREEDTSANTQVDFQQATVYTQGTVSQTTTFSTTVQQTQVVKEKPLEGKIILIDAGHGKSQEKYKEPVAPGSSTMKNAFVSGTTGKNQTEAELNLKVAKKLETKLTGLGATVYMTRTGETTDLSNVERAQMGNDLKVDISVRIHGNGSENPEVKGIMTMIPGDKHPIPEVIRESEKAGEIIHKQLLEKTGGADAGILRTNDLTGFNWSERTTVLVEMGYMTNPEEDAMLEKDSYQNKIVDAIAEGLCEYFNQ